MGLEVSIQASFANLLLMHTLAHTCATALAYHTFQISAAATAAATAAAAAFTVSRSSRHVHTVFQS